MTNKLRRSSRYVVAAAIVSAMIGGSAFAASTTWTSDADFGAGAVTGAIIDADSVRLATSGVGSPDPAVPWWNPVWGQRRCLEVINNEATPLSEYQIAVDLDTATPIAGGRMDPAGDDVRFVGTDGVSVLDHWLEGPIDSAATTFWVQIDTLAPGPNTVCIYYDNAGAPSVSDPLAPFTYSSPQPLYVSVSENQVGRDLAVVSYVDGNQVSDGTTSVTLAAGVPTILPGATHTTSTVITATGPLALRGVGDFVDTYVPFGFAGTSFVLPTTRSANRLSIHAPYSTATVTIEHSGATTVVNVPAGTTLATNADVTSNNDAAVVTSTAPVLVAHAASTTADVFVAVPATTEPLYGIRSTLHQTGFTANGSSVAITESDGGSVGASGDRGDQVRRTGGGSQGTGPAVRVASTAGGPVAAIQQADSDGGESSSYWPESELNPMYRVATASQYVALACPVQATGVIDSDGTTFDCTGAGGASYPGKARDTNLPAGALVQSLDGSVFHLYAEDAASNDEANVLGPKQARLATENPPTVTIGGEESPYVPGGTWESEAVDTGCSASFDSLLWNPAGQPSSTTLELQFASALSAAGPFAFVGPDGTAATTYTVAAGEPIAAVHDGDQFLRVRALFSTSDVVMTPSLDDLTVSWLGAGSLGGTLFLDDDGDGEVDGGEATIDGVPVELWRDDGDGEFDEGVDVLAGTTVSSGGTYTFAEQLPGDYFVRADEAALDQAHLLGATTGNPVGPMTLGECSSVTADLGWTFGDNLSAVVFSDVDGDGAQTGAEPGVAEVPVGLWLDDGDGSFDRTADTLVELNPTESDGDVVFATVPVGDYFVAVTPGDEPSGHLATATTPNPDGPITVLGGGDHESEIGFVPTGSISGLTFGDHDDEPVLAGQVLSLYDESGGTLIDIIVSDGSGGFAFERVPAGNYLLVPGAPPAGYLPASTQTVTMAAGEAVAADVPYPLARSIRGRIIADDDGVVDPQTLPLAGVVVEIWRDDGDGVFDKDADESMGQAVTDGSGNFLVGGLLAGDYFVEAQPLNGVLADFTELTSPNPVGPVAAGVDDVLFLFAPIDLTLPATGSEPATLLMIAIVSVVIGAGLLLLGRRRYTVN